MGKECLQVIVDEIGESPKDGLPGMFTCCNGLITGMLRSANSELTPFYGMTLSHGVENITHDDTEINEETRVEIEIDPRFNRCFF